MFARLGCINFYCCVVPGSAWRSWCERDEGRSEKGWVLLSGILETKLPRLDKKGLILSPYLSSNGLNWANVWAQMVWIEPVFELKWFELSQCLSWNGLNWANVWAQMVWIEPVFELKWFELSQCLAQMVRIEPMFELKWLGLSKAMFAIICSPIVYHHRLPPASCI